MKVAHKELPPPIVLGSVPNHCVGWRRSLRVSAESSPCNHQGSDYCQGGYPSGEPWDAVVTVRVVIRVLGDLLDTSADCDFPYHVHCGMWLADVEEGLILVERLPVVQSRYCGSAVRSSVQPHRVTLVLYLSDVVAHGLVFPDPADGLSDVYG